MVKNAYEEKKSTSSRNTDRAHIKCVLILMRQKISLQKICDAHCCIFSHAILVALPP